MCSIDTCMHQPFSLDNVFIHQFHDQTREYLPIYRAIAPHLSATRAHKSRNPSTPPGRYADTSGTSIATDRVINKSNGKPYRKKRRAWHHRPDKTRQNKTRQGKSRQDKARKGKARQGETTQGKTRQSKGGQCKAMQDKARQGKTRQCMTGGPRIGLAVTASPAELEIHIPHSARRSDALP